MGCTTGAKLFKKSNTLIAFKNKDFEIKTHKDKLILDHKDNFGVGGLNFDNNKPSGFSIGINKHGLVAVNSHVLTKSDPSYDLLTERIVLEAKTIDEAIDICKKEINNAQKYQWCNMVISTPEELAAIELAPPNIGIDRSSDFIVRTNHQLTLNSNEPIIKSFGKKHLLDSIIRYEYTKKKLESCSSKQEIVSTLMSHNKNGPICRHGTKSFQKRSYFTVYSYIVIVQRNTNLSITWDVVKGPPCLNSYQNIDIDFPLDEKKRNYIQGLYPV